ncbi:MAG: histidine triad nucleotide-binding protein, partial [Elusimicrobia bacterium]|nr:histidine triad nucleotide-binding protein [Elusimicrobiota bacterium]
MDCIFCKIAAGQIKGQMVHEDPNVVAFRDLKPQAPVHVLIIPRKHIASIADVHDPDFPLVGEIYRVAQVVAKKEKLANGFRVAVNCGPDAGQSVDHLHFHLLGGRKLGWPPG